MLRRELLKILPAWLVGGAPAAAVATPPAVPVTWCRGRTGLAVADFDLGGRLARAIRRHNLARPAGADRDDLWLSLLDVLGPEFEARFTHDAGVMIADHNDMATRADVGDYDFVSVTWPVDLRDASHAAGRIAAQFVDLCTQVADRNVAFAAPLIVYPGTDWPDCRLTLRANLARHRLVPQGDPTHAPS